jgi:peptidoglycan/LPS O-acetylase OafA/YrhL
MCALQDARRRRVRAAEYVRARPRVDRARVILGDTRCALALNNGWLGRAMMKQIDELDGLRGWMALWVWVTHVTTLAALPFDKTRGAGWVLANGDFAVGVFIILSGFVISMALADATDQPKRVFYVRRALRLFPAYLICLAISAFFMIEPSIQALQALPWEAPRTADRLLYLYASRDAFWTHLALHAPLLHGLVPNQILPSTSYAFMGQAWSLTLEWQFYLIAPFAFAFMRWFEWTAVREGALLIVLGLLARRMGQSSLLTSSLYLFAIGFFSFQLYRRRRIEEVSVRRFFTHVAVWTVGAALVGHRWLAILIWAPVLFGMLESSPPAAIARLRDLLCRRSSARLGAISYSFYCSHMIAVFGTAYLLVIVLEVRDHAIYATSLIVLSLLATLLFSSALHAFVEKPCIALGRRLARTLASKPRDAAVNA